MSLACLLSMKLALPSLLQGLGFLAKTSFKIGTPLTNGLILFHICQGFPSFESVYALALPLTACKVVEN